ncbi:OST-HTH/LOTUS domain-containing protein [Chitinophaga costaii]|uniref:OST-HTH/LOTUS domain-containing protein n=1 Tax=Chitinophaga costaii TaxID=1335309 RepID=A0A1C4ADP9_9BACT|nr:NYN domain-containing protein [Chitinophaga costaii]PUZ26870.1 NYN domain-containing protein [Chitinophaga costaii]SCB92729.1 OST-HTH/LOTUS domain-containing protein [Chitinophaga costaii]
MDQEKDLRLAMLIDADNISHTHIKGMMEELAKYGNPTFKRIYGDWTKPTLNGWKTVLLDNAVTPIQQYAYTAGKNSTDAAMIIDAMDILYTGRVDGFCLVSSDSDFTRLATRLREAGMRVFGMGEKKTPSAFRAACDKFIYLEILHTDEKKERKKTGTKQPASKQEKIKPPISKRDEELINLLTDSINDIADEDGWAYLGELGNLILKKQPDFDSRNYGYTKLVQLIKSFDQLEVELRETGKKVGNNLVYVRVVPGPFFLS